jgi:hypothetical protein
MSAVSCPTCGAAVPAATRFCPECGARLQVAESDTAAAVDEPTSEAAAPDPPSRLERPVGVTRARATAAIDAFAAQTRARFGLYRLRRELGRIDRARREHFRMLGEAVHVGDEAAAERARAALRELDDAAAAREREAAALIAEAEERIRAARLSGRPTVVHVPPESPGPQQET